MWLLVLGFFAGLCVSEYYNRFHIDRIRREQLAELRGEQRNRAFAEAEATLRHGAR